MKQVLRAFYFANLVALAALSAGATSRENLTSLHLPHTMFSVSKIVIAAAVSEPAGPSPHATASYKGVPGLLPRRSGHQPTGGSDMKIEVCVREEPCK